MLLSSDPEFCHSDVIIVFYSLLKNCENTARDISYTHAYTEIYIYICRWLDLDLVEQFAQASGEENISVWTKWLSGFFFFIELVTLTFVLKWKLKKKQSLSKCQIKAVNKDFQNCYHVIDDVLLLSSPHHVRFWFQLILHYFVFLLGLFFVFVLQSLIVCVIAMLKTAACFILKNMYMYSWAWRNIRDRVSSGLRDAKTFAWECDSNSTLGCWKVSVILD